MDTIVDNLWMKKSLKMLGFGALQEFVRCITNSPRRQQWRRAGETSQSDSQETETRTTTRADGETARLRQVDWPARSRTGSRAGKVGKPAGQPATITRDPRTHTPRVSLFILPLPLVTAGDSRCDTQSGRSGCCHNGCLTPVQRWGSHSGRRGHGERSRHRRSRRRRL